MVNTQLGEDPVNVPDKSKQLHTELTAEARHLQRGRVLFNHAREGAMNGQTAQRGEGIVGQALRPINGVRPQPNRIAVPTRARP